MVFLQFDLCKKLPVDNKLLSELFVSNHGWYLVTHIERMEKSSENRMQPQGLNSSHSSISTISEQVEEEVRAPARVSVLANITKNKVQPIFPSPPISVVSVEQGRIKEFLL